MTRALDKQFYERHKRPHEWLFGIVAWCCLTAFALAIAAPLYINGASALDAALAGAASTVCCLLLVLGVVGWRWRASVRRERGLPVHAGDLVEITDGPLVGQRGVVQLVGQSGYDYWIVLEDGRESEERLHVQARHVRAVVERAGSEHVHHAT